MSPERVKDLTEWFNKCKYFDWHYMMSDDHRVYEAGHAAKLKLHTEMKEDQEKQLIYAAWANFHFTGEPWKTPKAPEPKLEQFLEGASNA